MNFFGRAFIITINEQPTDDGAVDVTNARQIKASGDPSERMLRVQFSVLKNILQEQLNSAELQIFNLSAANRALLQRRFAPLTIEAGYKDNVGLIFQGQVSIASHIKEGPDWITRFSTLDGMQMIQTANVNKTMPPGSTREQVFKELVDALGVGIGNYVHALEAGTNNSTLPQSFPLGKQLTGRAWDLLADLAREGGFDLSIQEGQLLMLPPSGTTDTLEHAVVLDVDHGLIGNAEEGEDSMRQPAVICRSLMNPSLKPGSLVRLTSRIIKNTFFRIFSVKHHGDSYGKEWYSDLVMNKIPDNGIQVVA